MFLVWKDKREARIVSSIHDAKMLEWKAKDKVTRGRLMKSECIIEHNQYTMVLIILIHPYCTAQSSAKLLSGQRSWALAYELCSNALRVYKRVNPTIGMRCNNSGWE